MPLKDIGIKLQSSALLWLVSVMSTPRCITPSRSPHGGLSMVRSEAFVLGACSDQIIRNAARQCVEDHSNDVELVSTCGAVS